jgi:hypothetical protein
MGSFNQTCSLSSFPILPGDECVLMVMKINIDSLPTTYTFYSTDYLIPASLPFEAEYADYGRFENFKGDMFFDTTKKVVINMYRKMAKKEDEENVTFENCISHMLERNPFETKEFEFSQVEDTYHPFELSLIKEKEHLEAPKRMPYTVLPVLKKVWDSYVKAVGEKISVDFNLIPKKRDKEKHIDFSQYEDKWLNIQKRLFDRNFNTALDTYNFLKAVNTNTDNYLSRINVIETCCPHLNTLSWGHLYDKEQGEKLILDSDLYEEAKKSIVNFRLANYGVSITRNTWHFKSGLGSQSENWGIYKKLYSDLTELAAEKIKKHGGN